MKNILITVLLMLLIGCSKNDSLAFVMEASFTEQFSNACSENAECINTVDTYMESCFNKELAITAIESEKKIKKEVNTKHILEMQKCLSAKAGTDYWKEIDMPSYILSQVK